MSEPTTYLGQGPTISHSAALVTISELIVKIQDVTKERDFWRAKFTKERQLAAKLQRQLDRCHKALNKHIIPHG